MVVTIKIARSEDQWVASVPRAPTLIAWSPSLKRLRLHVDGALHKFYPELAKEPRREIIDLPRETRALLKGLAKAEQDVERAAKRAAQMRRKTSQKLRTSLGISIREVGDLMGLSGSRYVLAEPRRDSPRELIDARRHDEATAAGGGGGSESGAATGVVAG